RRTLTIALVAAGVASAAAAQSQILEKMEQSDALIGLRGLMIPPIERLETTNLIDAGTIDTDGYTHVTLNLAAELKGHASKRGVIGVMLIPDVQPFEKAYRILGWVPTSFDFVVVATPAGSSYLMAEQRTFEVGFPRYRALLYNSTGTSATVAFFAYRTKR
ncbi:MAG TPA: hypothetical protein VH854_10280, partial [Thermoanaerobaculia bacterium]|nr:hypothetical protein [Thermoanaerobaculia bacterium]